MGQASRNSEVVDTQVVVKQPKLKAGQGVKPSRRASRTETWKQVVRKESRPRSPQRPGAGTVPALPNRARRWAWDYNNPLVKTKNLDEDKGYGHDGGFIPPSFFQNVLTSNGPNGLSGMDAFGNRMYYQHGSMPMPDTCCCCCTNLDGDGWMPTNPAVSKGDSNGLASDTAENQLIGSWNRKTLCLPCGATPGLDDGNKSDFTFFDAEQNRYDIYYVKKPCCYLCADNAGTKVCEKIVNYLTGSVCFASETRGPLFEMTKNGDVVVRAKGIYGQTTYAPEPTALCSRCLCPETEIATIYDADGNGLFKYEREITECQRCRIGCCTCAKGSCIPICISRCCTLHCGRCVSCIKCCTCTCCCPTSCCARGCDKSVAWYEPMELHGSNLKGLQGIRTDQLAAVTSTHYGQQEEAWGLADIIGILGPCGMGWMCVDVPLHSVKKGCCGCGRKQHPILFHSEIKMPSDNEFGAEYHYSEREWQALLAWLVMVDLPRHSDPTLFLANSMFQIPENLAAKDKTSIGLPPVLNPAGIPIPRLPLQLSPDGPHRP
eukprot:m.68556 g.68556  ORF g.68556 m.68556 type:complete len:546 (-) comp8519_c0_seq1:593-2230(-)